MPAIQERSKILDDFLDNLNGTSERRKQSISLTNLRLADRFLNLEIHIILHLRIKSTGEQWGICIERSRSDQEGA